MDKTGDWGKERNSQSLLYKPDRVVYSKAGSSTAALGVMELKVSYKRNPNYMTDFVKLAKQMKLILHGLLYVGIPAFVVCGILIQGSRCETFAMDLAYNGVYRFMRLGKAALCLSLAEFGLFPVVFNNIVELKDIALATAISMEARECARQLGQEIPAAVPLSWLRANAGFLQRVDAE
ncbi:hypothetical protein EC973_006157 [Apophysomyces ossiformis]|uniref:Uncharacterized protein n=1 Tax=Apophysomyces ossiformis TaxID=679940 RepID=A0A8H7BEH1_9FUNG|nr:hypothetical protein EC973_006157 [Apophysomyces ossiformis]